MKTVYKTPGRKEKRGKKYTIALLPQNTLGSYKKGSVLLEGLETLLLKNFKSQEKSK